MVSQISIHVPREGHDAPRRANAAKTVLISIHVPREGHDSHRTETLDRRDLFQSTCPARGTTRKSDRKEMFRLYFNPRAPRGARR